jgi:hypothetical protein
MKRKNKKAIDYEVSKDLECMDYYKENIRIGDVVIHRASFINSFEHDECDKRKVSYITCVEGNWYITLVTEKGEILSNETPNNYVTEENFKVAKMYDAYSQLKYWIQKDMKEGKRIYTEYTDIEGIFLSERMILRQAFCNQDERLYYVAKNKETGEYYLQSFGDNTLTGGFDHIKGEYVAHKCVSITKKIEDAVNYEVVGEPERNFKPIFLDDFGYEKGKFPPIVDIDLQGKLIFKEVN